MSDGGGLRDRVCVVTGASGGIGRAACVALADAGARVVAVGRDPLRLQATVAAIRQTAPSAEPLALPAVDIRVPGDVDGMVAATLAHWSRLDVLVAAAGVGTMGAANKLPCALHRLEPETWDEVIATNLTGTFLTNRAVLGPMLRQGHGEILNVASARGSIAGRPYASAYCASKFGVMGLSEALADEVRAHGVRVQVLLPDAVDTPLVRGSPLTRGGALPPAMVAQFILHMLTQPRDALLVDPILAPFTPDAARPLAAAPAGPPAPGDRA